MDTQELKRIVEALIFAADGPLSAERILETLEPQNGFELGAVIDELNREYQESGRAFMIRQIAGGYQIVTQANYASWIKKLYLGRQKNRLSQAALETLALIAFKQPISRVEVAQIRGVNSDGVIGTLLERKLIAISGRSEAVGRPLLYSTTPDFLKYFGLNDLADLPKPREIEELFGKEGMPEELLHALSQEDPQLSLPINVESETSPAPDEGENQATVAAPAEQPAAYQPPITPSVVDAPGESVADESSESTALSEEATEPAPVSETEMEVVSIDINDEVVTMLDDFGAPAPSRSDDDEAKREPAPQAFTGENTMTTLDVAGDLPVLPDRSAESDFSLEILSIIPSTPQTDREEILPETLAAGVHELYKKELPEPPHKETQVVEVSEVRQIDDIPVIPSLAVDEISPAPASLFSPASDDGFATTSEIVLVDESPGLPSPGTDAPQTVTTVTASFEKTSEVFLAALEPSDREEATGGFDEKLFEAENSSAAFNDDPESEVDGWLAEEFSREEIAEPDFLLKAEERRLNDLEKRLARDSKPSGARAPAMTEKIYGLNGAAAANRHHEPARLPSPLLDEIFKEGRARSTDAEDDAAADNKPAPNDTLDSLSLALSDFPEKNGGLLATLRNKASGWIKRALAKLMAFVGKRPE
jgi:segregation and condensation protein B